MAAVDTAPDLKDGDAATPLALIPTGSPNDVWAVPEAPTDLETGSGRWGRLHRPRSNPLPLVALGTTHTLFCGLRARRGGVTGLATPGLLNNFSTLTPGRAA